MVDQNELLKQVIAQKRIAQKQLYDLYAPKMLGVCYRFVSDRDAAEEVMQQGFIKVFMQINSFRGDGSFEGWIRKIMVNTALNFLKHERRIEFENDLEAAGQFTVNADAIDSINVKDLFHHIAQLPAGYRAVLNLFAIEGYSHKEIGAMLNITESTSRSQYTRAKKLLAEKIQLASYAKHG